MAKKTNGKPKTKSKQLKSQAHANMQLKSNSHPIYPHTQQLKT